MMVGFFAASFAIYSFFQQQQHFQEEKMRQLDIIHHEFSGEQPREVVDSKYLGYLSIRGENRLIQYGSSKAVLDQNVIGLLESSVALNEETGNVILAGHNIPFVFRVLHEISLGEEILLVTNQVVETYVVQEKEVIDETDMRYFQQVDDTKRMTLVTCCRDKRKRLVVVLTKKE